MSRRVPSVARIALVATAVLLLTAGGRVARGEEAIPTAPGWDYEVRVEPGLARLHVRMCLRLVEPRLLVLSSGDAFRAVTWAKSGPSAARLDWDASKEGFAVQGLGHGECVEYSVDVEKALAASGRMGTWNRNGDAVIEATSFLVRPAVIPPAWRGTIAFALPEGVRVSAPWSRVAAADRAAGNAPAAAPETFEVPRGIWEHPTHLAFGGFSTKEIPVAGATFDLATLRGEREATDAGIERWLRTAGEAVAGLYGSFPEKRVRVLLMPAGPRSDGDPVPFGSAWQGGGLPTLQLLVASNAKDDRFPGEWVAVHEMTHLGMPTIAVDDAWLSEGLATYYQETLRSRAGLLPAETAWAHMETGFAAGEAAAATDSIGEASRKMRQTHQFRRVYWAGAAFALRADVALRREPVGQARSLDDVMRWLRTAFPDPAVTRTAEEILAAADRWLGRPVLGPIAHGITSVAKFPDVSAERAFLGFALSDGKVVRRKDAPGAAIAAGIFDPPTRVNGAGK